jgi:hypothetical protein
LEPEDFDALRDGLGAMAEGGFDGEALRDPSKLMGRLQEKLSPEDTMRVMEIFSEFMATPEGRAFANEIEDSVSQLEKFVNSGQGQQLGDLFRQFQGGDRGQLKERLEGMLKGRAKGPKAKRSHKNEEKRSARKHDGNRSKRHAAPPSGSKLY